MVNPCFVVSWRGSGGKYLTQLQNNCLTIYTICKPCLMLGSPGDLMVRDFGRCVQAQVCWDLFLLLLSLLCATEDKMHEDALLYAQWGSFSP